MIEMLVAGDWNWSSRRKSSRDRTRTDCRIALQDQARAAAEEVGIYDLRAAGTGPLLRLRRPATHFPQPEPQPFADLPNHVFHAARTTYSAATATSTPTIDEL